MKHLHGFRIWQTIAAGPSRDTRRAQLLNSLWYGTRPDNGATTTQSPAHRNRYLDLQDLQGPFLEAAGSTARRVRKDPTPQIQALGIRFAENESLLLFLRRACLIQVNKLALTVHRQRVQDR